MANSGVVGIRPRMSRRSLSTGVASPAASNRWVAAFRSSRQLSRTSSSREAW